MRIEYSDSFLIDVKLNLITNKPHAARAEAFFGKQTQLISLTHYVIMIMLIQTACGKDILHPQNYNRYLLVHENYFSL